MNDQDFLSKIFDYSGNGDELLCHLEEKSHLFILQSSQHDPHRGRYTMIGFDPFTVYEQRGKKDLIGLKKAYQEYAFPSAGNGAPSLTPLAFGVVGCLAYDYGLTQENILSTKHGGPDMPDCFFGFYDRIITIDHFTRKLIITSSGLPERDPDKRRTRAIRRIDELVDLLSPVLDHTATATEHTTEHSHDIPLVSNMTREDYIAAVRKALDHIAEGNIYQVNLSQCFEADLGQYDFDPISFYRMLCEYSPSPFGGYIDCGGFRLISNSPERFLSLNNGLVQTRPMKGTRPRGKTDDEDQKYRREILNSTKEQSELLMITDLQRNDLGRVCEYGSVRVSEHRTLEEYKYVFQATSNIQGTLRKDRDCFDLIQACFPGGSVTGCPKLRAMEVIEELEPARRGMYTGSMGYITFDGNMDMNILIRTSIIKDGRLYFQVGGGIVADSDPEKEYEETLTKAGAMRACLSSGIRRKHQVEATVRS